MVKKIGISVVAIALIAVLMLNGFVGFSGERDVSQSRELQEGGSFTLDDRVQISIRDIQTNPDTVRLSFNELDTNGYQVHTLNESEVKTVSLTGGDITTTITDVTSSGGSDVVVIRTAWVSPWGISEQSSKVGSVLPTLLLGVLVVSIGRASGMF